MKKPNPRGADWVNVLEYEIAEAGGPFGPTTREAGETERRTAGENFHTLRGGKAEGGRR